MKILLTTDGSAQNKAAVDEVANRLFPPETEVRIISIVDITALSSYAGTDSVLSQFYSDAKSNALKKANVATEFAAKLLHEKNSLLLITISVIDGTPKTAILEEAERYGADLIVVGSHDFEDIDQFMLGSVSHAVALYAKCSVEIVRLKNQARQK